MANNQIRLFVLQPASNQKYVQSCSLVIDQQQSPQKSSQPTLAKDDNDEGTVQMAQLHDQYIKNGSNSLRSQQQATKENSMPYGRMQESSIDVLHSSFPSEKDNLSTDRLFAISQNTES